MVTLLLSLFIAALIAISLKHYSSGRHLPPGPLSVPIFGNLLWLTNSLSSIEPLLRTLHARYGPIVTLRVGSNVSIFVADRRLAHEALVENGVAFADRPKPNPIRHVLGNNRHSINSAPYGPLWRLLRRNLAAEILHPSRVKLFSGARAWVLDVLLSKLRDSDGGVGGPAAVMESFQFAMFCLLVLMCFGEKLGEEDVRAIGKAQTDLLLYSRKLNVFSFCPAITKHLFRNRWNLAIAKRQRQKELYMPLIRARREHKAKRVEESEERFVHSYVDSLLDIEIEDEGGRKLSDDELVVLCSEFLTAGTDTTSTALQWIMAELVQHQQVQQKVWDEIKQVMESIGSLEVKEEHLHKMSYLKAVVLEALRRHPPAHFVVPHTVAQDVLLGGYKIPKGAVVNFMVAEIGNNEHVWEKPTEFKPERFIEGGEGQEVDITGTREIKMMPFGVGRRICPGLGLAMLHLEYFVANLVRHFEWKAIDGEEVDFSEKTEFTVVMKNPLKARLFPRS